MSNFQRHETMCVFPPPDVNVAFQQAAHKVLLDDDNLLPLLHLSVDYQGKDKGELTHSAVVVVVFGDTETDVNTFSS